ncbi:MAG: glutathione-dependent reductase [Solirubrobacterales bacterium]|nr:glutathione-dependent reductase [Solirubrobacterales bacterium]
MSSETAPFPKESGAGGAFVRQESRFRDRVTADGSSGFPAAAGRYHLYVSLACPWAHRAVIVCELKGLQDVIATTVVDPIRTEETGWRFFDEDPDPLHGWEYLSEGYRLSDPSYAGRVTVPVLWDAETNTIVSNESSEIIEMLNGEFDAFAGNPDLDLYPAAQRSGIDAVNDRIYDTLNNGVYRSGFAASQAAYEEAVVPVFATLDELEDRLGTSRFLFGAEQTLADWRLFTTLVRFDAVYHGHFKCNLRKIAEYPSLFGYLRDLYQTPGVAATVDMDQIKRHYYATHRSINPTGIVPLGPVQDLGAPHGRESLSPW